VKTPKFALESDLCSAFLAWQSKHHPDVKAYAEWAGWDILLVYPEGWQLGIQAKLRLNAQVILQAAPDRWHEGTHGPDFRAILVPEHNGWSAVAARLGLVTFWPVRRSFTRDALDSGIWEFTPGLRDGWRLGELKMPPADSWIDWNPVERHGLPPCDTDAIAGSPCPTTLTPWKLGALAVLATLEVRGTITAKHIRVLGINPSRWTQYEWLLPAEKRGDWRRGEKCPAFDQQHPTAYAAALAKAKETP
jgi:hypothetical protein